MWGDVVMASVRVTALPHATAHLVPCGSSRLDVERRGTSLALAPPTCVCAEWRSSPDLTSPYPPQVEDASSQQTRAFSSRGGGAPTPPRRWRSGEC